MLPPVRTKRGQPVRMGAHVETMERHLVGSHLGYAYCSTWRFAGVTTWGGPGVLERSELGVEARDATCHFHKGQQW